MERYHIIKRRKGWALKREGAQKAARVYDSKENARRDAEKYRVRGFEVVIHKESGYLEERLK